MANCFELLMQTAACALCFARLKAGKSMDAKIPMMAMTTNNSISVNAHRFEFVADFFPFISLTALFESTDDSAKNQPLFGVLPSNQTSDRLYGINSRTG
jgi:hypothetical protein